MHESTIHFGGHAIYNRFYLYYNLNACNSPIFLIKRENYYCYIYIIFFVISLSKIISKIICNDVPYNETKNMYNILKLISV